MRYHLPSPIGRHPAAGSRAAPAKTGGKKWKHQQRQAFSEEGSQQQKASFDGWRFSHYFEYVQRKENNLTVKCTLCPGRKLLSTACNSTSNLKKHLERQHGHIVAKRRSDMNEQPPKQQKLSIEHKVLPTSKSEINKLVASYVVEEMLPLSTVESLSFRNIISKIPIAGTDQPFSDVLDSASLLLA
ncbi:hypothetical protein QQF64_019887 [Cirrhinus molitorella]|uniref:BED-type domain-containing protein n=1 Tax=Cirrhinus molitorella TaxID=172907 RepID=A0ABR3LJ46_9TELE